VFQHPLLNQLLQRRVKRRRIYTERAAKNPDRRDEFLPFAGMDRFDNPFRAKINHGRLGKLFWPRDFLVTIQWFSIINPSMDVELKVRQPVPRSEPMQPAGKNGDCLVEVQAMASGYQ
jgi:hypothetical protein